MLPREVAHRADIDLAARQERDGAVEIDGEPALDPAEDHAGHPLIGLEALFELRPRLFAPRLLARQRGLAVLVFHAFEEDLDDVADMDLGFVAASGREFLQRHAAFGFEADIDQRGVILDADDAALDDGALEAVGDAHRFIEQRGEALPLGDSGLGCGGHSFSSIPDCETRPAGITAGAGSRRGEGRGCVNPVRQDGEAPRLVSWG